MLENLGKPVASCYGLSNPISRLRSDGQSKPTECTAHCSKTTYQRSDTVLQQQVDALLFTAQNHTDEASMHLPLQT